MPTTIPCLWFDHGVAERAAEFYVSVFPNSAVGAVTRYGPGTPGPEGGVMTVEFTLDVQRYVGLNGGDQFRFSEAISFQIRCSGQEEADHYWDALSEGGRQGPCGWVTDRFGVSWQIDPEELYELITDPDEGRAQRATQAMLGMSRIDIAELRRAADTVPA
jgi:predicted 3-demethylubiquinone-9 3-methyltransferase (glyoxalase superfamily)